MKKLTQTLLCAFSSIALANLSGAATNTDVKSMMSVWDGTTPGQHNRFAVTGTVHTAITSARDPSTVPCFVLDDGELLVSVFNKTQPPRSLNPGDRIVARESSGLKNAPTATSHMPSPMKSKSLEPAPRSSLSKENCKTSRA